MQDYYTEYFQLGQQKISYGMLNFNLSEHNPVCTLCKDKVYRERLLDVMGVNFMKYHRFEHGKTRHLEAVLAEKTTYFFKNSGDPEVVFVVSKCRENTSRKKYSRVTRMS